jgi:hypothetical protein
MDLLTGVIAWEAGKMTDSEETTFFQMLITSGDAWALQGYYGRTAIRLIEEGRCTRPDPPDRRRQ